MAASPPRRIDPERLPRLRAAAQLLHRPAAIRDPAEVARRIVGAQAQDRYAGPLSFRSRSRRITAADVTRARTEKRSLLRTWVMRMTIHMIATEDAGWMLPLFEPAIERWSRRRLEQLGLPADPQRKALAAIERGLVRDGPMTRSDAGELVEAAGVRLNQQTRMHVMLLSVTSGLACLGPDRGATTCLVLRRDWLDEPPRANREAALAELARRYLRAFGPATDRDLAYWSGLGLREVRSGLAAISAELVESSVGGELLLDVSRHRSRLPAAGRVGLLGAFDTYMLGYADRAFAVPEGHAAAVKEGGGGWIRPIVVRDGVVIGGWRYRRRGKGVEVELGELAAHPAGLRRAIETEVADIARFEGVPAMLAVR
jgi:hypothetical protein